MKPNYPPQFAQGLEHTIMLWKRGKDAVIDLSITQEAFIADPANRFAQEHRGKQYKYSDTEIASHWKCVDEGRKRMMAFYLVHSKQEKSFDYAIKKID